MVLSCSGSTDKNQLQNDLKATADTTQLLNNTTDKKQKSVFQMFFIIDADIWYNKFYPQ